MRERRRRSRGVVAACVAAAALAHVQAIGDTIVFARDGNLWSMDGAGGQQRPLTSKGVGHVSASRTGILAMDRFKPYGPPAPLADLNVYQLPVDGSAARQLTRDGRSVRPEVAPDGTKVVFEKFEWKGERNYLGRGRGLWLIDVATGAARELVGVAPLPESLRKARSVSIHSGQGTMDAAVWLYDGDLHWSADGRSLLFTRSFERGGNVTYWVDLSHLDAPELVAYPGYPCGSDVRGSRMLCFDNGDFALLSHDFASGKSTVLAKDVFVGDAKFSPDGQRVAFVVKSGVHLTQSDLWTVDSSGQNLKKISSVPLHDIDEVWWTADGQRLVFERYYSQEMRSEVWSVASDGSDLRRLAENAADPRPTRGPAKVVGEMVLPLGTLWGQDRLLYVDTKRSPCVQVPADTGNPELVGVKVGCPAVAVGQLINYWYEQGYSKGWLDTMLEDVAVYPRPWSFGGMGRAACTHPGFAAEDSYRSAGWESLKQFLWHVGMGLDTDYDLSISGLKVYPSEKLDELICPPQECGTLHGPERVASLLEGRFRFKVIKGPSQRLSRLDDASEAIEAAIDARRPVLLMLSEGLGGAGHMALIQGYRRSSGGGANQDEYLVNFGWGPKVPARWVPGGGSFQTGSLTWKEFWVIDVAPVSAPADQPSLSAAIKVGVLKDDSVAGGCGCYVSPLGTPGGIRLDRLLLYSDTECNAWINLDGRDVKLRAEPPGKPREEDPQAQCDALPETYRGEGVTLKVSRQVTRECPPEPTECEVTDYNFSLSVERGAARQTVRGQGSCGC